VSAPGSGFVVEWRTPAGAVPFKPVRVWSEREAWDHVAVYASAHPALAPWIIGPRGGERMMQEPLRAWDAPWSWTVPGGTAERRLAAA
jgi:hypothetical protein